MDFFRIPSQHETGHWNFIITHRNTRQYIYYRFNACWISKDIFLYFITPKDLWWSLGKDKTRIPGLQGRNPPLMGKHELWSPLITSLTSENEYFCVANFWKRMIARVNLLKLGGSWCSRATWEGSNKINEFGYLPYSRFREDWFVWHFADAVKSFTAKIQQWCWCLEHHRNGGSHYIW